MYSSTVHYGAVRGVSHPSKSGEPVELHDASAAPAPLSGSSDRLLRCVSEDSLCFDLGRSNGLTHLMPDNHPARHAAIRRF